MTDRIAEFLPLSDESHKTVDPDAELVERCRRRDRGAFRFLVERYSRRAWKIAYGFVGEVEIARDLSQEAFLRVWNGIQTYDARRGFKQWFDRIVVNLSIDYLRKHRNSRPLPLDLVEDPPAAGPAVDDEPERNETRRRVREIVRRIPVKYQTVLVMRDIDGKSCEEIAQILMRPAATIRWRLSKARKIFQRTWERESRER